MSDEVMVQTSRIVCYWIFNTQLSLSILEFPLMENNSFVSKTDLEFMGIAYWNPQKYK